MLENLNYVRYIYHYTSLDILLTILENYRKGRDGDGLIFHANKLRRMNDPTEMEASFDYIKNTLVKYEKEAIEEKFWLHQIACDSKYEDYCKKAFIVDDNGFLTEPSFIIYTSSFSAKRDYLPMWTLYGDTGKGVCLKFDLYDLIANFGILDDQNERDGLFRQLGFVEYNIKSGSKDLENVFYKTYNWYLSDCQTKQEPLTSKYKIQAIGDLCFYLAAFLKYRDYKYEKEFRIVYYRHYGEMFNSHISVQELLSPHIYKVDDFIEYSIPTFALKEIIMGPNMNDDVMNHIISRELDECKIKVNISKSKVPFRTK